jgi:pyridoxamine 5'-phosphate oxidase
MEISASHDPLVLLQEWIQQARSNSHIKEPTAMTLATQASDGTLNARVVLCKQISAQGLVFFTNYESRKGTDLAHHSQVAVVFYWDPLFKQVKISGRVAKTSREVSEKYWATRPRESQISQSISRQSQPAPSAEVLHHEWEQAEHRLAGDQPIPCPAHWGGYQIHVERIEFWIGRPGRWHDRYEFTGDHDHWTFRRLYP